MPGTNLPNTGLTGDFANHDTWGDEGRADLRLLDALVMPAVESVLNAPPGSPADGARYLIGTGPSGVWASFPNRVAQWDANFGDWRKYTAKAGWRIYVRNTNTWKIYTGSAWVNDDLVVDVRRYGATGDGTTNDTSAVSAALTAAPAGSRVHFPAGTYYLSSWSIFTLNKSLWLSGDGIGNTVIKSSSAASVSALGTNAFSLQTNFRCSDMTFDSWGDVFNLSTISTIVDKILFEDIEIKNYLHGIYASASTTITVSSVNTSTETITTSSAHGLAVNDQMVFANTAGALPGGITAGTTYYVLTVPTSTTLTLSATLGGSTLNITTSGSGTTTAYKTGFGFRNLTIRGCRITSGLRDAILLNMPVMERISVTNNIIVNCVGKGIDCGGNALALADVRGEYVIEGNVIEGVTNVVPTGTGGAGTAGGYVTGAVIAIICYGWRATITNNIVKDVNKLVPTDSDCDGIYTKCRYSVVANNVLVDAGQAEGFINIKGGARNETVAQPYGYSVTVVNNTLVDTQASPASSAGTFKRSNGIKIATSEVLVANNYLEGLCEIGIYTDSDTGSDAPNHDITIMNNVIKNHRGKIGIDALGRGDRIRLIENHVDGVTNEFDDVTLPQPFGILVSKKEGLGVDVIGNRVVNVGSFPVVVDASTDTFTSGTLAAPIHHSLTVNDTVRFTSSTTLPAPLVPGTAYYVKTIPTSSTFTLSASAGPGSLLDITDAGFGNHMLRNSSRSPVGISMKPGSYTFDISVNTSTDTITTLSGANPVAHVMNVGEQVRFIADPVGPGTVPGGITASVVPSPVTYYYILTTPTTSTFTISATLGGSTIDITSAGTGTTTVQRKMTHSSWRVLDNHVDGALYGVQFTWDETLITVDDVLVRHNTGRNLNGNTIAAIADIVKYSDTITNLIDLPAQAPVVSYEATDAAAIYQASGADHPQEMRVYRNRIDANNYERVVMRAKSSSSVIGTEFKGNVDIGAGAVTAVKRALELGVAQSAGAAITSYWRVSTTGNWEPLNANALNIGSSSLPVNDISLTGNLNLAPGGVASGNLILPYTNAGSAGAVTIDKISGRVLMASGATTLVLTNNKLSSTSHVFCQIAQADTNNPRIKSVVYSASGGAHVTITVDTAPAADMAIDFLVTNSA